MPFPVTLSGPSGPVSQDAVTSARLARQGRRNRTAAALLPAGWVKEGMSAKTSIHPPIASRETWLAARKKLLRREKKVTREYDRVSAARRAEAPQRN